MTLQELKSIINHGCIDAYSRGLLSVSETVHCISKEIDDYTSLVPDPYKRAEQERKLYKQAMKSLVQAITRFEKMN